ncbi:MAG: class I SAM-dependent methyltransferase [Rickettsiales bacterium]|jgi:hypothetical protein|nr:class I SAM-dependent methyltransferase [Rickettsiales bacterium]
MPKIFFANGFEGKLNIRYNLITSFENFEHFVNPMAEIKNLTTITDILFFSTLLIPSSPPPHVKDWWYFSPFSGQHIAFYTKATLEYIAKQLGLFLLSNNVNIHIFSKHNINPRFFRSLNRFHKINNKINFLRFLKQKSKIWDDFQTLITKNT